MIYGSYKYSFNLTVLIFILKRPAAHLIEKSHYALKAVMVM